MRILIVISFLLISGAGVTAQNCGNGLPCGPIPWRLPNLPELQTPTPMPTNEVVNSDPNIPGGTETTEPGIPGGTALPQISIDDSGIEGALQQIDIYLTMTPTCITDVSGQCVVDDPQSYAPEPFLIFGYFRALAGVNFGIFTPVIWFLLAAFTSIFAMKMAGLIVPIVAVLFGLVRKVVNLVLNFLPL